MTHRLRRALPLAALVLAAPACAQATNCQLAATLEVYSFLAARALTSAETATVTREVKQHMDEAQPDDCANLKTLRGAMATKDPVAREQVRVAVHTALWFDPKMDAARKATLQRIAPVVVADDANKILVRRRAVEAFLSSVKFVAGQMGMTAPADTVAKQSAETRRAFSAAGTDIKTLVANQEGYDALLRRDWAKKGAAWRKQALGSRPADYQALQNATAKVQLALANDGRSRGGGGRYPWQERMDRFIDASSRGMVSSAVSSAMAGGRP